MGEKNRLLNFKQKRKLLFGKKSSVENLAQAGQTFLEAGQLYDALDFFLKAGNPEGLKKIRKKAVEEADPVLLKQVLKNLETEPDPGEWKDLGKNALEMGKKLSAEEAFRMAGDWKTVAKIRGEVIEEGIASERDLDDDDLDDDDLDDDDLDDDDLDDDDLDDDEND